MKRALATLLVFAAFLSAGQAAAGGNGWGKGGKHEPAAAVGDASIAGPFGDVRFGGEVWFESVVPDTTGGDTVVVWAGCYQNGEVVWGETEWAAPTNAFVLGSTFWSPWIDNGGGPASCVGELKLQDYNTGAQTVLASVAFDVTG